MGRSKQVKTNCHKQVAAKIVAKESKSHADSENANRKPEKAKKSKAVPVVVSPEQALKDENAALKEELRRLKLKIEGLETCPICFE